MNGTTRKVWNRCPMEEGARWPMGKLLIPRLVSI